jgi:hypothetical protein
MGLYAELSLKVMSLKSRQGKTWGRDDMVTFKDSLCCRVDV